MSNLLPGDVITLSPPPLAKCCLDRRLKALTSHALVAMAFVIGALRSAPSPPFRGVIFFELCCRRDCRPPCCAAAPCCLWCCPRCLGLRGVCGLLRCCLWLLLTCRGFLWACVVGPSSLLLCEGFPRAAALCGWFGLGTVRVTFPRCHVVGWYLPWRRLVSPWLLWVSFRLCRLCCCWLGALRSSPIGCSWGLGLVACCLARELLAALADESVSALAFPGCWPAAVVIAPLVGGTRCSAAVVEGGM